MLDRRLRNHETAEDNGARGRRGDDALRARAGALDHTAPGEIEMLDRGRRVADIEAGDRATADLAGEEKGGIVALQGKRLLVLSDENDLARSGGDAERRGGEGAKDINDDHMPRRTARALEEARDAHIHRDVIVAARRARSRCQT